MSSIIDRALQYHNDYKAKTGRLPEGPFFVFESEWEKFVASDECFKYFPNAVFEASPEGKFTVGNMHIYLIRDIIEDDTV